MFIMLGSAITGPGFKPRAVLIKINKRKVTRANNLPNVNKLQFVN